MPASEAPEIDVSVVVPVYHNSRTLDELCRRITSTLEGEGRSFEIVCVDDGSRDDSWEVLRRLHEADPRVRPFRMARNFGQAAALCAGLERIRGRVAVTIDADLQNQPEDIPLLLAAIDEGHDLVGGVRQDRDDPRLSRKLPSWLVNRMVQALTGVAINDVGSGLNAATRELTEQLPAYGEMRRFIKPLVASLSRSYAEVPISHRAASGSGYGFLALVSVQLDFFTSFSRKPFQLVGIGGILLFGIGLVGGLVTLALLLAAGVSVGPRIQALLVMAMVFGLQLCVVGLLGEFIVRIYHSQNQPFYVVRDEAP